MTGFDVQDATRALSEHFSIIMLRDVDDDRRIQKRMDILEKMLGERGLSIQNIPMKGENFFEKAFSSFILAEWTAYYLGTAYKGNTDTISMVDEFKNLMAQ